ncbi:Bro-N domain-containing protein [Comamonas sp. 26]|uniref:BRO-N domain-containing protein n=1 Tax=Comamonas sp. 26 TaxID=2035201 RepID=UPI000C19B53B|nr:Bro-N domain-containing protein [Comamonas sp. 26]PIG08774.1 BRO family protein [Comamonas sp. 26]
MADITPFNFGVFPVRVISHDNQQWFAAADVCAALGIKNHRDSLMHLDEDEKGVVSSDTLGGLQNISVVNESGLYALVLRSRKPEARKFAKWVTSEVLPSIRQTGGYAKQPDTRRTEHARQLAHAATLQVYQAVFDAAMQGDEPAHFTRLLLSFTQGPGDALAPYVKPMEAGAMLMTLPQLTQAIRTDLMLSDATLARLAAACTQRMAERTEYEARRRESGAPTAAQSQPAQQGRLQLR